MLENLLIFQVTSEIMTGIRLFPNWRSTVTVSRGHQVRTRETHGNNNNNEIKINGKNK